jgi:hypothetical protein
MLFLGARANRNGIRMQASSLELVVSGTAYLQTSGTEVNTGSATLRCSNRISEKQGAAIASGSTTTLGVDGNYFHVTGTTTINYITTTGIQAGHIVDLYFDGALTVTHNAGSVPGGTNAIQLVGGVNLSAAANSKLTLRLDSTLSKWVEIGRSGA